MRSAFAGVILVAALLGRGARAETWPVAPPRLVIPADSRVDGATASDGKSCIAAWTADRTQATIFAARITSNGDIADPWTSGFVLPGGAWIVQSAAVIRGDTILAAMDVASGAASRIAVARVRTDGAVVDRTPRDIGEGRLAAVATNGKNYLVAWTTPTAVEIAVLSPDLRIVARKSFPEGRHPRVAANGERYLCVFDHVDNDARGVIVDGEAIGDELVVAREATVGGVTSAGESWAVPALRSASLDVCAVRPHGVATCRQIAPSNGGLAYVADVVFSGGSVYVAWFTPAVSRPVTVPPPVAYDFRLTRVTPSEAIELDTRRYAPAHDDDVILFRYGGGDPVRVGRKGLVTAVPIAFPAAEQRAETLLPSGDGVIAFWSETARTLDAMVLHATRFTSAGADERVRDRVLGTGVRVLGGDGVHVLLNDGRLIGADGEVAQTIDVPNDAALAAWDGERWLFVTSNGAVRRGAEMLAAGVGSPRAIACTATACLVTWVRGVAPSDIRGLSIDRRRPLRRARPIELASDVGHYLSVGAARAGDAIVALWANGHTRTIQGRVLDRHGRIGETVEIARALSPGDPLFFRTADGADSFILAQNAWPELRINRVSPSGQLVATAKLEQTAAVAAVAAGDRVFVLHERGVLARGQAPARRALVTLTPPLLSPAPPAPRPSPVSSAGTRPRRAGSGRR